MRSKRPSTSANSRFRYGLLSKMSPSSRIVPLDSLAGNPDVNRTFRLGCRGEFFTINPAGHHDIRKEHVDLCPLIKNFPRSMRTVGLVHGVAQSLQLLDRCTPYRLIIVHGENDGTGLVAFRRFCFYSGRMRRCRRGPSNREIQLECRTVTKLAIYTDMTA